MCMTSRCHIDYIRKLEPKEKPYYYNTFSHYVHMVIYNVLVSELWLLNIVHFNGHWSVLSFPPVCMANTVGLASSCAKADVVDTTWALQFLLAGLISNKLSCVRCFVLDLEDVIGRNSRRNNCLYKPLTLWVKIKAIAITKLWVEVRMMKVYQAQSSLTMMARKPETSPRLSLRVQRSSIIACAWGESLGTRLVHSYSHHSTLL